MSATEPKEHAMTPKSFEKDNERGEKIVRKPYGITRAISVERLRNGDEN